MTIESREQSPEMYLCRTFRLFQYSESEFLCHAITLPPWFRTRQLRFIGRIPVVSPFGRILADLISSTDHISFERFEPQSQ
jgi:hypothetical protein